MYYGVAFYPEHKTPDELTHDLKLLKESGINTVRMGEFAWSRFEPEEGHFDFSWLDPVVEELGKSGIHTILCTPTACPPAWLFFQHPDIAYVDNRRVRRPFGGRRHYCYNSEEYRKHCLAITTAIAKHYGNNPYVIGFQIDNEPAQESTGRCCCPTCTQKFQEWLRKKYGTISEWNRRSGAVFWSQEYTDFSQISPPINTVETGSCNSIEAHRENPTLRLEFERFSSDSQIEFQDLQWKILKTYTDRPVTTNSTNLSTNSVDYYKSFQKLDRFAFDAYPRLRDTAIDSFPYAFARGVKKEVPFWILEFYSGGGHQTTGGGRMQPNPGAMKQSVIQAMAHGAEMLLHFQFRTFPFGAEQLNYAIVDADGIPRRRYREVQETAELLQKLRPLEKTELKNQVAIGFDYDCLWALKIKPINKQDFTYIHHASLYYKALASLGIGADVISFNEDLSPYKVIILPAGIILSREQQSRLKEYVQNGGSLVATFLTSVKNEDNVGYTDPLPSGLSDVFGVVLQEIDPVYPENRARFRLNCGESGWDGIWSELLDGPAEQKAVYETSYKKGQTVVSHYKYGKGHAWYLGTYPEKKLLSSLLLEICRTGDVPRNALLPPDGKKVEIVKRLSREMKKAYYFIFNFDRDLVSLPLGEGYTDYLTREKITEIILPQNATAILETEEQEE